MSDSTPHHGGTQPLPAPPQDHDVDGLRLDTEATAAHRADTSSERAMPDPVAAVKDPDNRAKLLLAVGLLTLLNFLLLLGVLASVMDDNDQVVVDGTPCIIDERDGEAVLFCQR